MKVLFVFAHIDDAEIYSGGTMLKLKDKNIDFNVCLIEWKIMIKKQKRIDNWMK